MTRGEGTQSKIHFKGKEEDYIVLIDDIDTYKKWQGDRRTPLSHFVSSSKIFLTHRQGAQGTMDTASKSMLASEFDTEDVDECITIILQEGSFQNVEAPGRQGPKNDSMSSMKAK